MPTRRTPLITTALLLTTVWLTEIPATAEAQLPESEPVWYGIMDAGGREFRFAIEESKESDGSVLHELVSFDEGSQKFRLDEFQLDDDQMKFSLKRTKAEYEGQRGANGDVVGKWKQSGTDFDLNFRRQPEIKHEEPAEVWTGAIHPLFQKLELQIRVYKRDGGKDKILFDSITQKAGGFKATRSIDAEKWIIDVPSIAGKFAGIASADGAEVSGKWTQGGLNLELQLKKAARAVTNDDTVVRRPQNPVPPFPYSEESVSFGNLIDDVTLAGTLTVPQGDGPFPAAILISGSGPQDRDESLMDHKPFWVIADYLTRHGTAVLRYDDRGVAQSTGNFATATTEDAARDAEAALDFLRRHQKIRPDSIGFVGHSEGGIIAPLIAERRADTAFIVLLAGTGVNGKEILLSQGQLIIKAEGVDSPEQLELQRDVQMALIALVLDHEPGELAITDEQVMELLKSVRATVPESALPNDALEEILRAGLKRIQAPWFKFFLTHEPASVLEKVTCPVLALNGEKDVQVDPKLNLPTIRKALENGGNKHFEIVEYPNLNHLFQTCETGGLSEYQKIEETIAPIVLDKVSTWIQDVVAKNDAPEN